ncbi:MAG: hypothetical protein HC884_16320 [Chloroflexaceae bacterium]|nr:hypothetical protein [Chloroflexaceae bacterium]
MHTQHHEQATVEEIVEHIPASSEVLRSHDVDISTRRVPLEHAAQAVSASTDEMLAVMEYRIRRAAQNGK